ncbi:LacI family DNA-binding transcriptional regulator [Vibrio quintilis]|uniref:HTH-type transcriptional regulator AscG n=1 Tax=Vibrio quintilis TaxID=1117707 RepID=A0A1M7YX07_9VIBR|nr:LacI family DNA-binding transcriptional regulator [Vibrio quintilis]SHO57105.1 HTH-type transcriptional regulator AscG [Vibrio quintilis]
MTTISDVCKLANVSKATVSRVLSGNRRVKEDTREAVMRAVEQLNYRPNQLAQTLATKVSYTVGVLTHGLNDLQLGRTVRQLERDLTQQGRCFIMANYVQNREMLEEKLSFFATKHCDAVLLVGRQFDIQWFEHLNLDRYPPLLTMNLAVPEVEGLNYDQATTTEMACNYLYSHGHTQIAMLSEAGTSGMHMQEGYRRALENRSLPYNKQLVVQHGDSAGAIGMLINRYIPFTAVLAADDHQAIEVIRTLEQYNLKVPQEVSVLSLNTDKEGAFYSPAITGFEIPEEDMLTSLTSLLDVKMSDNHLNDSGHQEFFGKLIIRESVRTLST